MSVNKKISRSKIKQWDVFSFAISEIMRAYGHILEINGRSIYIFIYRKINIPPDIGVEVNKNTVLFCGWTIDGCIRDGEWVIEGNLPLDEKVVPKPCWKIGAELDSRVIDFSGKTIRSITSSEFNMLDYQVSFSPAVFVHATAAANGCSNNKDEIDNWPNIYKRITYSYVLNLTKRCEEVCNR